MNDNIKQFINSQARNKLIVATQPIDNIIPIDVGKLFLKKLHGLIGDKRLSLIAKIDLDELLDSNVLDSDEIGKYLAIKNIGVLLENQLNIDFEQLLMKHSRDKVLILNWEGEIENDCLYFLSKPKGIKINIKNLSHIII